MIGTIQKLKDKDGNFLYPLTIGNAVIMDDDRTVIQHISDLKTQISTLGTGSTGGTGGGTVNVVSTNVLWDATKNGVTVGDNDSYADANTTAINSMLANASCPGIFLPPGVIKVSGINLGSMKALVGSGSFSTFIKAKTGMTVPIITITNGYGTRLRDLTVDGSRSNTTCDGVLVQTNNPNASYCTFQMQITHIRITQCGKTGLRITGGQNWVFNVHDVMISLCNEYGLDDGGTDNTYSDIYISACAKAGALIRGSNNKYANFKVDWSGWTMTNQTTSLDGANLIICAGRLSFANMDIQQGHYVGIKIIPYPNPSSPSLAPKNIVLHGSIDSNGVNSSNTPTTGIYAYMANNISGNISFDDINSVKCQTTSVKIENNCSNIRLVAMGSASGGVTNSVAGTNCSVIS